MTTLTKAVRRTLSRPETSFVVEMSEPGIRMREKGRRTWMGPGPWGWLYVQLARLEADARIAARKAKRKGALKATRKAARRARRGR